MAPNVDQLIINNVPKVDVAADADGDTLADVSIDDRIDDIMTHLSQFSLTIVPLRKQTETHISILPPEIITRLILSKLAIDDIYSVQQFGMVSIHLSLVLLL